MTQQKQPYLFDQEDDYFYTAYGEGQQIHTVQSSFQDQSIQDHQPKGKLNTEYDEEGKTRHYTKIHVQLPGGKHKQMMVKLDGGADVNILPARELSRLFPQYMNGQRVKPGVL